MTTDLKAANYVLFNSYDYLKPEVIKYGLRELFGSGAFCYISWGDTLMMLVVLFYTGLLI